MIFWSAICSFALLPARVAWPQTNTRLGRAGSPRAEADASGAEVDVAVIGGGPAGYVMAALMGREGHAVAIVDPYPDRPWPNNYGAWRSEWQSLSESLQLPELMTQCISKEWDVTDCYFGGSHGMPDEQRTRLGTPYVQVNRAALKAVLDRLISSSRVAKYAASLEVGRIPVVIFRRASAAAWTTFSG